MPKQIKELKDFSGGLNTKFDSKDIQDNEFIEAKGVMFDKPGKIRLSTRSERASDGTTTIPEYISPSWLDSGNISFKNGYGLGFINSDNKQARILLKVRHSIADSSYHGKYLSPRINADDGVWMNGAYTILRVVEVEDKGSDPDHIYCVVVKWGALADGISGQGAYARTLFKADTAAGDNSTSTGLVLGELTSGTQQPETLTNGSDFSSTWTTLNTSGGTANWTVNGGNLEFDNDANSATEWQNGMYQKESQNAVTWEPDSFYSIKITFTGSGTDISAGNLRVGLLGNFTSFDVNDQSSQVINAVIQSGSMTADDNVPWSNFIIFGDDSLNDVVIDSVSLKQSVWEPISGEEATATSTTEGEANLVVFNNENNTLNRYSYETGEWTLINTHGSSYGTAYGIIQQLSIDASGDGTLATKTGAEMMLYNVDTAIRLIDTNFKNNHLSNLLSNYWWGYIEKNIFGGAESNGGVGFKVLGDWRLTLMDIHPPYKGNLVTQHTTTPTLTDGYLTMMARTADSGRDQTMWENGADPDGWFAGKSGTDQDAYKYNRGASFRKALLDAATQNGTSPDSCIGAYSFVKNNVTNENDEKYIIIQYHSDYDYQGGTGGTASTTANSPLNITLPSQQTIMFELYISDYMYTRIDTVKGIDIHLGSTMHPENFWDQKEHIQSFVYNVPPTGLSAGWQTITVNTKTFNEMLYNPDMTDIKKFAVVFHLTTKGDIPSHTSSSDDPPTGHDYNLLLDGTEYEIGSETTAPSGSGATVTNHYRQLNLDTAFSDGDFVVGDMLFVSKDGNITSEDVDDEWVSVVEADHSNNRLYVTRPHDHQNIWASSIIKSGGRETAFYGSITSSSSLKKVSKVVDPAGAICNIRYGDLAEGQWNGEYKFHYSWVYDGKQESKLFTFPGTVKANKQAMYFNFWSPEAQGGGWGIASELGLSGYRIDKARIYYSKVSSEEDSTLDGRFFLLGELDFDLGFKLAGTETYEAWSVDPLNSNLICVDTDTSTTTVREDILSTSPPVVDVFESSAGYSHTTDTIMANFKNITFNNGIAYVATPYQATNSSIVTSKQQKRAFPDRILKSLPNNYDIFPSDNFIDVTVDDGESIVALESFNDRLLQFKQNTLHIINIAGELEYLEDSFQHLGVQSRQAVVKSDVGVLFANRGGIYLYGGEGEPLNLIGKVNETDWNTFAGDGSNLVCIYISSMDQVVVAKTDASDTKADSYIVDIPSQTVSKTVDGVDLSAQYGHTNVVLDTVNGQPVWISDDNSNEYVFTIDNFDDSTSTTAGHASGGVDLQTKFHDFDRPGVRKKIHLVRINYKSSATTNVSVKFDTNQGTAFDKLFANGTNFTSNELASTSGAWATAELKPNTSSQTNNIYSFALRIFSDGIVPEDFQINDISIVYRYKSVK